MWRRFATFALQKAKYLCPYKSRKVLSQALQFQTLTAQSPVGYVTHRLGWIEGSKMRTEIRWAADDADRYRRYSEELVALAPDVILAGNSFSVAALQRVTHSVPSADLVWRGSRQDRR